MTAGSAEWLAEANGSVISAEATHGIESPFIFSISCDVLGPAFPVAIGVAGTWRHRVSQSFDAETEISL